MAHSHRTAAILAIGDEIVLGQNQDTNSAWLAGRLLESGVRVHEFGAVADERAAIAGAIRRLSQAADLLLTTGGLGPTPDDVTRDALGDAMGEPLVEDPEGLRMLEALSLRLARPLPSINRVQAMRPRSASLLANPKGTAPGIRGRVGNCDVFCLPGPPREMRPMFDADVEPALSPPRGSVVRTRFINTFGLGESAVAERLGDALHRGRNPLIGLTTDNTMVRCRIRYEGAADRAAAALDEAERTIRTALAPYVYGVGEETLAESVLAILIERGRTLATVESCTGGLLSHHLTSVPGSSAAFVGGWVTYSNVFKSGAIAVPRAMLQQFGAVSAPVARAMAEGGLLGAPGGGTDHCLAITGVAGPEGGSPGKPVGTVYIARASRGIEQGEAPVQCEVRRFRFSGERGLVRERSARAALMMLRLHLIGAAAVELLWEWPETAG